MTDGAGLGPRFAAALAALPRLPAAGAAVVVAVSGGADSMALWDLLVRSARWRLVVWHLDHGLRAEAGQDLALIERQLARYRAAGQEGGALVAERTQVGDLARRWRVSLETAGRRQRYERLAAVAREHGAGAVLTAHHRDDQAETVLANLLRGAGPVGSAGMPPQRQLGDGIALLRPLLGCTRDELRVHCRAAGVVWLEDASNDDTRHHRNWLRHAVLPALEAGVPGFSAALAELAQRRHGAAATLEAAIAGPWQEALGADDLLLEGILGLDGDHRRQLWRRLALHLGLPLERAHLERLDALARGPDGRRLHLGRWLLLRRARTLRWELAHPLRNPLHLAMPAPGEYQRGAERLTCTLLPAPPALPADGRSALLDAAACAWPLVWRPADVDERFTPLGAPGRQTVVKFLSSRGVPSRLRPGSAVVADAHGVVWVPGYAIADRARLTAATREVLALHWTPACGGGRSPTVPPLQDPTDARS